MSESLKKEIEQAKRKVSTETVQITIGEIINMYENLELNIIPEFQRLFRWSIDRKSNFIESIFIGIPIPPAFVYENDDGTWELIDGLQRISTILEFVGKLKNDNGDLLHESILVKTKYLPSLEGISWSGASGGVSLDRSLQLFFRRHRFDFQVLKYPSDPKAKFDLFQRLNRGGEYATEQEVRSCAMVLANREYMSMIREISFSDEFISMFKINDESRRKQKNVEYMVRCLVHTYEYFPKGRDVQDYLDEAIIELMTGDKFNYIFNKVSWSIGLLYELFGDDALIPMGDNNLKKTFTLRALEGVVVGIARNKEKIEKLENYTKFVINKVKGFWECDEVEGMSSPGLRGSTRLMKTIPFGEKWFNPDDQ